MRTYEGPTEAIVIWEPFQVANELASLGLSEASLLEAIRRGEIARNGCTPNHPRCYPGSRSWAETTCALRDIYGTEGWSPLDLVNFPLTVNPTGDLAIAVEVGDERTGVRSMSPKTKYPMGTVVFAFVERNKQMSLPGFRTAAPARESSPVSEMATWILLRYRSRDELRSELSLPVLVGDDQRIYRWARRIVLKPLAFDPTPGKLLEDDGEDFDVKVTRRSA